ncbi:MAG TPA: hypothetical protein VMC07_00785 [Candidatus Omnitrophota bacterium]|nr:hypothetical protein [Candidatus Omnitrophota bacterium]
MAIAERTRVLKFLREVNTAKTTSNVPLEEAVKRMKNAEKSVERQILDDLSSVENPTNEENKELRTIVRVAFERFAFDPNFQEMYRKSSSVMESLKGLKKIYYENILSSTSFTATITQHMKDLTAILDPRLDEAGFNERARELGQSLLFSGRTEISDKLRYSFITEEIKRKQERLKRANILAGKRWNRYFPQRNQATSQNTAVSNLNGNVLDSVRNSVNLEYVKATPDFKLCMTNPLGSRSIPEIKTALRGYQISGLDEKLSTIFSQNTSISYTYFINEFTKTTSAKNAIVQRVIDNYASKSGKKSIQFKITDMNSSNWKSLASYYNIDQHVGNFVLKLKGNYTKSLVDMINQTYEELRRTPGIQN